MTEAHPGLVGRPIYLDYNATTPVDPRVVAAMLPYLTTEFGNPSSAHAFADAPARALRDARHQVASLIGAPAESIVFTGSGSEANTFAIVGTVLARGNPNSRVITQHTEHPAVLATCAALHRTRGVPVTLLPVDRNGMVDPDRLAAAMTGDTALVSIMYANNETGTIQPIAELAHIAHEHGALFHTDAAQAVGKVPVDVAALGVDLLTVVGHKMYAPKGVAALYIRPGIDIEPLIHGGGQERGLRAGTENVALAVALGAAAEIARADLATSGPARIAKLRDALHEELSRAIPDRVLLNGHPQQRLPNTLNVSIAGLTGGAALLAAVPDVAASTGSACHSGDTEPSPVLTAMGLDRDRAANAVRLSLGRWSGEADIATTADLLVSASRLGRAG
jgi:cysteine desulfurase